ncbi:MAG: hypothetical protein HY064_12890 [Bacteroidetes bacterium]|nr:hypothetical protein [Bacteroidota bacterium]
MKVLRVIGLFLRKKIIFLFLILVGGLFLNKSITNLSDERWKCVLGMDGRGYYSYLPSFLIYHDPSCSFYKGQSEAPNDTANFLNIINGNYVNKYFVGEALCQLPFFIISGVYAKLFHYKTNGFSEPYMYGVAFAAIFYLLLGLYFLWNFLRLFNFSDLIILFVLSCFVFGTNLFNYAIYEPAMSHTYSFAVTSIFLYFSRSMILSPTLRKVTFTAASLAIVTLIRPVDSIIILAIPMTAGNANQLIIFRKWLIAKWLPLLVGISVFIIICSIQLWIYYWQTRHFFQWSYQNEGFNFKNPHIWGTLFSYDKGLFVYAPMIFIGVLGLLVMFFRSRFIFACILPPMLLIVFIISSWHDWRYGWGFGLRAYIGYYSLVALPFAFLTQWFFEKKIVLPILFLVCGFLIFLNLIQVYQYQNKILHPGFMNKERYWLIFLKTGKEFEDTLFHDNFVMESEGDFNDMEGYVDWPGMETIVQGNAHSGTHYSKIDSHSPYSAGYCKIMNEDFFDTPSHIKISAWVMKDNSEAKGDLIITETGQDSIFFNKAIPLPAFSGLRNWYEIATEVELPERKSRNEQLKVFFVRYNGMWGVDDFSVKLLK